MTTLAIQLTAFLVENSAPPFIVKMINRNLHYHHLAHPIFSDTMYASTVSRRSNRCAQEYATDLGWVRAFPMALRSEAHDTLLMLVAWDGVLPACICISAKEMIQGKFYQKLKDAMCQLKQFKQYTPWSNAEER